PTRPDHRSIRVRARVLVLLPSSFSVLIAFPPPSPHFRWVVVQQPRQLCRAVKRRTRLHRSGASSPLARAAAGGLAPTIPMTRLGGESWRLSTVLPPALAKVRAIVRSP